MRFIEWLNNSRNTEITDDTMNESEEKGSLKIRVQGLGLVRVIREDGYKFITESGERVSFIEKEDGYKFEKGDRFLGNKILIKIVDELIENRIIKAK